MRCSWGRELMLQLDKILHRIGIQFSHKLHCFKFCSLWFYFGRLGCILVSFFCKHHIWNFDTHILCAYPLCFEN
jgi:hypothetical protein